MRLLLALAALGLLGTSLGACGGTGGAASSTNHSTAATFATSNGPKDSNDKDDDAKGDDDTVVLEYGHPASPAEAKAITTVLKRYYAAMAATDGAKACSMLASPVAEAVTEDNGYAPSPAYLRGTTCAVVMSKLLKHVHRPLALELKTLTVTSVRIDEGKGLVVMSFATTPEPRKIPIVREGGAWKIEEPFDSGMP